MSKKITQMQANKALLQVAQWLGEKGYGGWDEKSNKPTPAPTGALAAREGIGPMLKMDWDWPGSPTPTIILEGGSYDWAIDVAGEIKVPGVFAEPYAGYALCLYPA